MAEDQEQFSYRAVNSSGKQVTGTIRSSSPGRAYQLLRDQNLQPLDVKLKDQNFMEKDIEIPGLEKKAKLKALVIFTKQFALLINSGMPLLESISISAQQTDDPVLKKALKLVKIDVERGLSLSRSMRKHPQAFPGLLTSVIEVGEEGGFIDKAMQSMSKTYQTELELKQRIKSAMTYPLIVIGVATVVIGAMMIFVIPIFKEMFENLDADLPTATKILVAISENAVIIFPILAVFVIACVIFFRVFKDRDWLRSKVDAFKIEVPIFGALNKKTMITRFSRNLSMMLRAGVPLTTSLKLVANTADNYLVEQAVVKAIAKMENGATIAESMDVFTMFPTMVKRMIAVGERSGSLPPMLDSIGDFYENEVRETSEKLAASLEPILLLVLGVLVGGMLFALYLPMFSLYTKIAGA